jgi:hypothetical protein
MYPTNSSCKLHARLRLLARMGMNNGKRRRPVSSLFHFFTPYMPIDWYSKMCDYPYWPSYQQCVANRAPFGVVVDRRGNVVIIRR